MTLVPIFIMAASSGPEAGRGAGAASFLDSSRTVAEPPCVHKLRSSSLLSVLGPGTAPSEETLLQHCANHMNTFPSDSTLGGL